MSTYSSCREKGTSCSSSLRASCADLVHSCFWSESVAAGHRRRCPGWETPPQNWSDPQVAETPASTLSRKKKQFSSITTIKLQNSSLLSRFATYLCMLPPSDPPGSGSDWWSHTGSPPKTWKTNRKINYCNVKIYWFKWSISGFQYKPILSTLNFHYWPLDGLQPMTEHHCWNCADTFDCIFYVIKTSGTKWICTLKGLIWFLSLQSTS